MWPWKLHKYGVRFHTDHHIGWTNLWPWKLDVYELGSSRRASKLLDTELKVLLTQFVTLKVKRVWVGWRCMSWAGPDGRANCWTLNAPLTYFATPDTLLTQGCCWGEKAAQISFNSIHLSSFVKLDCLMWRDNEGFPVSTSPSSPSPSPLNWIARKQDKIKILYLLYKIKIYTKKGKN